MSSQKCRRVAVVGTGVSGLAAIKTCVEEGMTVVAFESRPCVGGLWSNTKDKWTSEGPCMYSCLVTNTSKSMTCYSDFPCPASYPPYMPYHLYNEYLDMYADHFNLKQHIQFNTRVVNIARAANHESTGRWDLTTETKTGKKKEEVFDGVIICAGFYSKAWIPDIPGLKDKFRGHVTHSKEYENCTAFVNKTVLVVGNASSAGDIACDVSSVANQVYLSVGDGCGVIGRTSPSFLPADFAIKRIYNQLLSSETLLSVVQGRAHQKFDHRASGLLYTGRRKTDCPIIVSDDLPPRVIAGKIKVIPYVSKFGEHGFSTIDGKSYEAVDHVIFATGYSRDLSMLDPSLNCGGEKLHLYKQVFPVEEKHHTLALVGCIRAIGPMPPTLELQARMAAYTLSGRHKLPAREKMRADVEKFNKMALRPDGSYKYSYLGIFIADNTAAEIGVKPRFWELLLSGRPKLAYKCFFGTAYPFHYRIRGPGIWQEAESAIDNAVSENLKPLQNRSLPKEAKKSSVIFSLLKLGMTLSAGLLIVSYFFDLQKIKSYMIKM